MPEKILVIDDEPLILTAVERALTRTGYVISTARDRQGLVTALGNAPFDLLITDIHMKEESVETIVEEVKKTSPSVRVIFMSGAGNKDNYRNFIEKPFKISDLREKVRVILHEPS
jgi:two-component system, cell cycle sensor histidine kinase and response regulator CckA